MEKELRHILDTTLCEVLEKQAFVFAEEIPVDEVPEPAGVMLQSRISFSGPFSGTLLLYAPELMCCEIAANFLGVEPDAPGIAEKAPDALREMLNVICGNFLTAAAGDGPVFDLTVPQANPIGPDEWARVLSDPALMCYLADDHVVLCRLDLQQ